MWFANECKSVVDYLGISSFFNYCTFDLEKKKKEEEEGKEQIKIHPFHCSAFFHHLKGIYIYGFGGGGTESDKMPCMNELFCCHSTSQSCEFHIYI